MSTPLEPLPRNSYADFRHAPEAPDAPSVPDPDDPPWGAPSAFLVWVASMFILVLVPLTALVGYLVWRGRPLTPEAIDAAIKHDPQAVLASVVANIPAHLLIVALVWLVATGAGRRPFWRTLGMSWGKYFGFWASAAAAFVLLVVGLVLVALLKGGKTPFDEMLESSAETRFAAVFMATFTAPLVEELVYRGVLYPAVRRATNTTFAVFLVSALFAFVHVQQYYNNLGVIAAITLLSLSLTLVRAMTGKLLPCVVIHAVFNGLQCLGLVYEYFNPIAPPVEPQQPVSALLFALAASFPF
ncbi:MAG TPA: CPBP family intramembrane glutamic endopeptidase [Pyrinomonadaceae bacterium]|nr:CPBP family intramembrane glutamic endopeptidase [Pyrinomonadaceae bacterium]